jgi:hypothetical protein
MENSVIFVNETIWESRVILRLDVCSSEREKDGPRDVFV